MAQTLSDTDPDILQHMTNLINDEHQQKQIFVQQPVHYTQVAHQPKTIMKQPVKPVQIQSKTVEKSTKPVQNLIINEGNNVEILADEKLAVDAIVNNVNKVTNDANKIQIYGFSLPKQTLYLILILIIVGIIIWYLTSQKKKKSKEESDKKDDEEEN